MRRFVQFVVLPLAGCVVALLVGVMGGCAYLNGDAMWLGEAQKGVSVSNTLMTLIITEYDFKEGNLPFAFTCEPSRTSYEFGLNLQTNSVFKVRFVWGDSPEDGDEFVEIRNGVARIHKRDKSGWLRSNEDVGTEIACCTSVSFCLHRGEWWFYANTTNNHYFAKGALMPCKEAIGRRFVIEECQNAIFWHVPNWYEWGCH